MRPTTLNRARPSMESKFRNAALMLLKRSGFSGRSLKSPLLKIQSPSVGGFIKIDPLISPETNSVPPLVSRALGADVNAVLPSCASTAPEVKDATSVAATIDAWAGNPPLPPQPVAPVSSPAEPSSAPIAPAPKTLIAPRPGPTPLGLTSISCPSQKRFKVLKPLRALSLNQSVSLRIVFQAPSFVRRRL